MAEPTLFQVAMGLMAAGDLAGAAALGSRREAHLDAPTLNVAATCYARLGQIDAADSCYRRALAADISYGPAYSNYGLFLQGQQRWADAERILNQAVSVSPELAEAHNNLASLHGRFNRWSEAEAGHREALRLKPDYPGARFNLGTLLLAHGRFDEGWPHYEARRDPRHPDAMATPGLPFPEWRGESLAGKSLLIWYEQGFGDEIQFARYAPWLKAQGAKTVSLVCKPELGSLFQTLKGVDAVIPAVGSAQIEPHDYWSLPLSLPIRCETDLETIPGQVPYLTSQGERRNIWSARLGAGGRRVGLAWRGSTVLKNDINRSLSGLRALLPLWGAAGVQFYSLQKGPGEEEAGQSNADQPIVALGQDLTDFADTAAVIDQLDLVITVDTAVAHLAGALGRPCWVLLPWSGADWRWLRDREDSPWYPTLRLFRQGEGEAWDAVVVRVAEALRAEFAAG